MAPASRQAVLGPGLGAGSAKQSILTRAVRERSRSSWASTAMLPCSTLRLTTRRSWLAGPSPRPARRSCPANTVIYVPLVAT